MPHLTKGEYMITKSDIKSRLYDKYGHIIKKAALNDLVDDVFEEIAKELVRGESVKIEGFGIFGIRTRTERKGINPNTKESIIVPETKNVKFKSSNRLKRKVCSK